MDMFERMRVTAWKECIYSEAEGSEVVGQKNLDRNCG